MADLSKDKEAMQNTIKNIQAKTDYIYGLENKASKVLVLELGSHTIKLGFANERVPFTIKPFIAYKKKNI